MTQVAEIPTIDGNITATTNGKAKKVAITITAPNFQTIPFLIRGNAPLVMHRFSEKARNEIRDKQLAGSTANKGKKREPKEFKKLYEAAKHKSPDGWIGMPASAFRNAMISACKISGFHMTKAKMTVFIVQDGYSTEGIPLIKFKSGDAEYYETPVRLATGVPDLRARPMWKPGWEAVIPVKFDADIFTPTDISNLMMRAGLQVGVFEGRPDSPKSNGMGWGTFDLIMDEEQA